MRDELRDRNLSIMADESCFDKPVLVITFSSLDADKIRRELSIEFLDRSPDGETVYARIRAALLELWGSEEEIFKRKEQVLALVTDGASYMKTAAYLLRTELGLSELVHVTCVTHGLSLVCEAIRKRHPLASRFLSLMKRSQANSILRKQTYRDLSNSEFSLETVTGLCEKDLENLYDPNDQVSLSVEAILNDTNNSFWASALFESESSDIWNGVWNSIWVEYSNQHQVKDDSAPLPPHPCNTRFATFIVAINFYFFFWIRTINYITALKPNNAANPESQKALKELKSLIQDPSERKKLKDEIDYLHKSFSLIPVFVARLEKEDLEALESQRVLEKFRSYLASSLNNDKYGTVQVALDKFDSMIDKNDGLKVLCELALEDKIYDYCCTATIRIERKFSAIKRILGDRRHFKNQNLKKHLESAIRLQEISPSVQKRVSNHL